MQDQRTKSFEVSVLLPKTFETQPACVRVVLFDTSPGAAPFTKLDTYDVFVCDCSGRVTANFDNIPPVESYGVMTHVQIKRDHYVMADAFKDYRPGDCVTPLMVPISIDEDSVDCAVEITPIELIEHPPLLGEAY